MKQGEITYDKESGTFSIDAVIMLNVVGELVLSGVRGAKNFPLFGAFLDMLTASTLAK